MKFYIQESTGSHRSQATGDVPDGFVEVNEEKYETFVNAQQTEKQQRREAAMVTKQEACTQLLTKLQESTQLPVETIALALGMSHE